MDGRRFVVRLELVSHALCPFVHRSAIMLAEKGVAFEHRYIDLSNKPDWFLAISPRGKVPVLTVDGEPLFESSAINEFIDETHPPRLLPDDPFERARQRAWVEVANDLFAAQYGAAYAPAERVDAARDKLGRVLSRLEQALTDGTIDGRAFGLVPIAMAPALYRFVILEERAGAPLLAETPGLAEFAREVARRPSVVSTVPDDFADRYLERLASRGSGLVAASHGSPGQATP